MATDDDELAAVEAAELLDLPAGRVARWQSAATERTKSATSWAARMRERNPVVDAGFLIYERDRVSAGSVLGSAIAFRLFLFFVPFVLFCVGLTGLVSGEFDADSISSAGSLRGQLAEQVRAAQDQSRTAQLIALADRPVPDGDHREVARQGARRVQQPRLVGARQRRRQGACARRDRRLSSAA